MYQRILVAVDFSSWAEEAMRFATRIAARDAKVRLAHVIPPELAAMFADRAALERIDEDASRSLRAAAARCGELAPNLPVETVLLTGSPHEEILAEAQRSSAEVIVLGSHGRSLLPRLMLGSVAERVVRGSPRPVCVVKGQAPVALHHVALATDFGPASVEAVRQLDRFLQATPAKATVVHCIDPELGMSPAAPAILFVSKEDFERRVAKRRAELESAMQSVVADLQRADHPVASCFREGRPWRELSFFTEEARVDLLVIGTHRRRGMDRLLLGSVAEKTLRLVDCPVLVVPSSTGE
jgi:nucleotide-binding universal stress UspA family protein